MINHKQPEILKELIWTMGFSFFPSSQAFSQWEELDGCNILHIIMNHFIDIVIGWYMGWIPDSSTQCWLLHIYYQIPLWNICNPNPVQEGNNVRFHCSTSTGEFVTLKPSAFPIQSYNFPQLLALWLLTTALC